MVCMVYDEDEDPWHCISVLLFYYKQYMILIPGQDPEDFKTWLLQYYDSRLRLRHNIF